MPKPSHPPGKPQPPASGTLTLSWAANTEPDVAGYKVYCGTVSHVYDTVKILGKVTTATFTLPVGQTYYCAVTAFDVSGNESTKSSEVSKVIP